MTVLQRERGGGYGAPPGRSDVKVRIGLAEARSLVLNGVRPLAPVRRPLLGAVDHVLAAEVRAPVDAPMAATCMRDGVALRSEDATGAGEEHPVTLHAAGRAVAGGEAPPVGPGEAVEVTTGAVLPPGADAVVPVEASEVRGDVILVRRSPRPGEQVMPRGGDVARGQIVGRAGDLLSPGHLALLAAAGVGEVEVVPRPRVVVLSTGDEVVLPGTELREGQVYASNLVLACGWLRRFGMEVDAAVIPDAPDALRDAMSAALDRADAVLTAGGTWGSERDLTVRAAADLGGTVVFHRVRLGPGKAAALVLVAGKPVFCLPGGPPSFESALLHLALPGLLAMAGRSPEPFPRRRVMLREPLRAEPGWTKVLGCQVVEAEAGPEIRPRGSRSRMLPDPAVAVSPEGGAATGETVDVLDITSVRWG
jgi:molybdopterin molybdotransferase